MKLDNLFGELHAAQLFGANKRKASRQFATVLPPSIADYIEREAERMMISGAAVLRQLIAKGIQADLESNPPPWWEDFKESVNPPPKYERLSLPAKSKEAKSALSHHSKETHS